MKFKTLFDQNIQVKESLAPGGSESFTLTMKLIFNRGGKMFVFENVETLTIIQKENPFLYESIQKIGLAKLINQASGVLLIQKKGL
jgi:hypothetical protein|tara:strand:- start:701 stop:958 length:258 start_codon:yes stop_codon:yes gene_type:complete